MFQIEENTSYRQPPKHRPSNPTTLRSQRQRLEHIRPTPYASVNMYPHPPRRRLHALRQRINRRRHAVQLPPPVIADHNAIDSHLNGLQRVLGGDDALDPNLHLCDGAQPGDLARPGVRVGVEVREAVVVGLAFDALAIPAEDREAEAVWGSEL